ncbi:MAG: sigma 54-interacting transcriptional regulator, partial [Thauera sp.]
MSAPAAFATAGAAPARLLVVDDDVDLLRLLSMRLQASGYHVTTADGVATSRSHLGVERFDLVLSDVRLPDGDGLALFEDIRRQHPALPVILLTAHGSIPDAVEATALGVAGYLTKPFDSQALLRGIRQALQLAGPSHARAGVHAQAGVATPAGDTAWRSAIISRSSRMQALLDEARLVAVSDASVLIRGDSGTGKELLARAIHLASPRAAAPFVAINCGAIPEPLLESELFGHVRGAFTGATSAHEGLVQAAHGGTLFLDEIGDMPPALQVKLLRVLQERAVRPVGATRAQAVDLRIVSATHRDLDAALAAGQFREDLYYRINVVSLQLLLAEHFLRRLADKYAKRLTGFAPDALETLATAPWPGNVRQLHNVVEQVCALATTALIPRALVERALRLEGATATLAADGQQAVQILRTRPHGFDAVLMDVQ